MAANGADLAARMTALESAEARRATQTTSDKPATAAGPSNPTAGGAQPPMRRITAATPSAAQMRHAGVGVARTAAPQTLNEPVNGDTVVIYVATMLHVVSPADVRMYGSDACTMAGMNNDPNTTGRPSLQRLVLQDHSVRVEGTAPADIHLEAENYVSNQLSQVPPSLVNLTFSAIVPYPGGWPAPGHGARPENMMLARVHMYPVEIAANINADLDVAQFTRYARLFLNDWYGRAFSPSESVSACHVAAGLTAYRARSDDEAAIMPMLYTLITATDFTPPTAPRTVRSSSSRRSTGDAGVDAELYQGRFPDLKKFLYYQILDLPDNPMKEWPPRVSMQLWHLNIVLYFTSGAVGVSFPLLAQFGPDALVSNIVTLVKDASSKRFDRLRNLYESHKVTLNRMTSDAIRSLHEIIEAGGTPADMQAALILSLCSIFLYLRSVPYGRDPQRMADLEIRRLLDIKKAPGIADATWLVEASSRLHNWRTLHGVIMSMSLQKELRDFLYNIAAQLEEKNMEKFVEIMNDMMVGWAKSHYDGDLTKIPGIGDVGMVRQIDLGGDVRFAVSLIEKITDLSKIHAAGTEHLNGDAGKLLEQVLAHAITRWVPDEWHTGMLAADGSAAPDSLLLLQGDCYDKSRNMLTTTSTRLLLVNDALADREPFPMLGSTASATNTADNVNDERKAHIAMLKDAPKSQVDLHAELVSLRESQATLQKNVTRHFEENARELSQLGLLTRANTENSAGPLMKHAENPTPEPIAAIAVDSSSAQPAPRRPPAAFQGDIRRKNLGTRNDRDRRGAPRDPRKDGDPRKNVGPRPMRLLDKPKTQYDDIAANVQTALGSDPRVGIANKSEWDTKGGMVCPLCPARDHDLWRCVKIWAATSAGQKWLGSAKAAEFVARFHGDRNGTLMMREFVMAMQDIGQRSDDRDTAADLANGTLYVCEYCDIDIDRLDDADATDVIAMISAYADLPEGEMVAMVTGTASESRESSGLPVDGAAASKQ